MKKRRREEGRQRRFAGRHPNNNKNTSKKMKNHVLPKNVEGVPYEVKSRDSSCTT